MITMIPVKKLSRVLLLIVLFLILVVFLQNRSYYMKVKTVDMASNGLNNKARDLLLKNIVKAHVQHFDDWKNYDSFKDTQFRDTDVIAELNETSKSVIQMIDTKNQNEESNVSIQDGVEVKVSEHAIINTTVENERLNDKITSKPATILPEMILLSNQDSLNIEENTNKQKQDTDIEMAGTTDPITDDEVDERFRRLKLFILFIGYSRSGSSLTATILDAHQHVVISHELDILRGYENYKFKNYESNKIYNILFNTSRSQSKSYRAENGGFGIFNYYIPNTHQGTYEDYIQVIGDKEAEQTTQALTMYPRGTGLDKLRSTLKIPIKFVHVVRNPFDIIATRVLIRSGHRLKENDISEAVKIDNKALVISQSNNVLNIIDKNKKLREEFGDKVLDVNYSNLLKNPRETIMKMCNFLEITCDKQYLSACEEKLYANETYTRQYIVWPYDIKQSILNKIRTTDFLEDFQFDI